jgi:hypothetical protein
MATCNARSAATVINDNARFIEHTFDAYPNLRLIAGPRFRVIETSVDRGRLAAKEEAPPRRKRALGQREAYRALMRWADRHGMPPKALADYLKVAKSTIYTWRDRMPQRRHRIVIFEKTGILFPEKKR